MTTVVVSSFRTLSFLQGGGHFWVYMQYVEGLRRLGCDVYWFECVPPGGRGEDPVRVAAWLQRLERFGMAGRVILQAQVGDRPPGYFGLPESVALDVFSNADLLLNFHYALDARLLARFRRTALVDIDPGLLQLWMTTGLVPVAPHDVYFTTGETVGTSRARFPDCGLDWVYIPPPVCVERWPYAFDPRSVAYTTVTNWWGGGWAPDIVDGREVLYSNEKRDSFLAFAAMPRLTRQSLELAVDLCPEDEEDRRVLEGNGWRLRPSSEVTGTPEAYQSYIQASRGEFSLVKPSWVRLQNAWISDRSLCYLASGKPVVMQDTGPSSRVPLGEGLLHFSDPEGAAEALARVDLDYEMHCRSARALAETYFDARTTVARILEVALA